MQFEITPGGRYIECVTYQEQKLKKRIDDIKLDIKKIYISAENRNKRKSFEKFCSLIEKKKSMCLLFIHSSIPSKEDLPTDKKIYYEYLILVGNGGHRSFSSRIYNSDTQENRLHALENIYDELGVVKVEKEYTLNEKEELKSLYSKYECYNGFLVEKLFKRLVKKYNISGHFGIFSYPGDNVEYNRIELKMLIDGECSSYNSNIYHKDILDGNKDTSMDFGRLYSYEKSRLLSLCLNDLVSLKNESL